VLDRFLKQLFSDVDNLVIQEYRFYRYLFLTTIKTIFILLFVPFVVNFLAKNYVVKPITEYFWNTSHPEIFLNSYEQKRAFAELEKFEEKIYFEALVDSYSGYTKGLTNQAVLSAEQESLIPKSIDKPLYNHSTTIKESSMSGLSLPIFTDNVSLGAEKNRATQVDTSSKTMTVNNDFKTVGVLSSQNTNINSENIYKQNTRSYYIRKNKDISKLYQEKAIELAMYYNNHSIEAWTNFFADLLSLCTLLYLLITLEIQINITKSFLLEVFFGLDDSKKSLLILLVTDLLVGYHSSNLWELFFEFIFNHYGIPESQTGIFLLVATLPVLLDVLFKYLIFRHLNRSSPATVATYQAIIE
jgi:hypothetical protein